MMQHPNFQQVIYALIYIPIRITRKLAALTGTVICQDNARCIDFQSSCKNELYNHTGPSRSDFQPARVNSRH